MTLSPTSSLVAVAWLSQRVVGFTASMVATVLPRDVTAWGASGFVQVTPVAGTPDIDTGARRPILQLDFWTVTLDAGGNVSDKPPRGRAAELGELFVSATQNASQTFGRPVTLPAGYGTARVLACYPVTELVEVPDDPAGFARFTIDAALDWART